MTAMFDHLDPRIMASATADDAQRIAIISSDWWLPYPPGEDIIRRLFAFVHLPTRMRPPSLLVHGKPNAGKSAIIARFCTLFETQAAAQCLDPGAVVRIQAPPTVDEKRLYIEILGAVGAPTPETTVPRLRAMVVRQLRARNTKLLIIDEIQHALDQRPMAQQVVLNTFKYLSNELGLSIAGFGSSEAKALVRADDHLAQRFEIVALPAWDQKQSWVVDVIRQRIALFPLRRATVVDRSFMKTLLEVSGPVAGRMFGTLERCAIAAIHNGDEKLSSELIEAVTLNVERLEYGL